jgi:hypothetical protein
MTQKVVRKLEYAFTLGCTDAEACTYAGISRSTLHAYCQVNARFMDRKEALKSNIKLKAKSIIFKALEDGDLKTANKVIDRVERLQKYREQTNQPTIKYKTLNDFYVDCQKSTRY